MPQLSMFVACERTITEASTGLFSMIAILEKLTLGIALTEELSEEMRLALRWSIVSQYRILPGEHERSFEQQLMLVHPSGNVTSLDTEVFSPNLGANFHRVIINAGGFPMTAGDYVLQLFIREPSVSEEWQQLADYPIVLTHSGEQPENDSTKLLDRNEPSI